MADEAVTAQQRPFVDGATEPASLILRPWTESDAPALREAVDEDLGHLKPWLGWTLEEPASLARTRSRLRRWVDAFRSGTAARYAITPSDRQRILGGAWLKRGAEAGALEVGYWVRRSATRRGIATAAVSRLVVHAFDDAAISRLIIRSDVANDRSAAFARALGFESIEDAAATYPDGSPRPVHQFEMTRQSYRERHAPTLRDLAGRVHLVAETVDIPTGGESNP